MINFNVPKLRKLLVTKTAFFISSI